MGLTKTQFLIGEDGTLRTFKRKSAGMLFGRDGPIRPISWSAYGKLLKDWPKEAEQDGLRFVTVWTLVETTGARGGTRTPTPRGGRT